MNYIVATQEWMAAHGLLPLPSMRKSKDGSKIILHEDYFNLLARRDGEGNPLPGGADVYAHNSAELAALLQSEEWQAPEGEEAPQPSPGYIQAAAARNLMAATKAGIQSLEMADSEALELKDMYPQWEEFVNQPLAAGMKVQHGGKLWKVRQDIAAVLENQPPSVATAALYEEISESHAGTLDDPIPYNNNMELEQGKHYSQGGKVYLCTRSTGQAVYNNLADLVGIYVQEAGITK